MNLIYCFNHLRDTLPSTTFITYMTVYTAGLILAIAYAITESILGGLLGAFLWDCLGSLSLYIIYTNTQR